jgi:hypothetical protein
MWCHHDHDEELGEFWYSDPPPTFPKAPKAADMTAAVNADMPPDIPRLIAKLASTDPPPKQPPVRQKPVDVSTTIKADRQQGEPPPPGESISAVFRRHRDEAYWDEAGNLLLDYFELQAGTRYDETLVDGFIAWLRLSPARFRLYVEGDDMARAGLVDRYLRVVR